MKTARLGLMAWTAAAAGLALGERDDRPIDGESIVELAPGVSIEAINASYGTEVIDGITSRGIYLLRLPMGMTHDEFEALLLLSGETRILKEDPNVSASDPGGDTRSFYGARTVGDYGAQGAADRLDLAPAHALSTGAGVVVAVLDTGADAAHAALSSRLIPGWNFVTDSPDTGDVARGVDTSGNGVPDEFVGHGTMIAGMIGLVAPDAAIMPIVVLDSDGRTTSFRLAKAVYEAIDRGADVINLSLGTSVGSAEMEVVEDAVFEARQRWISVVAAAGNYGSEIPEQLPAAFQANRTIATAAADWDDLAAQFTSFGAHVAVCAPGVDAIGPFPGGGYQIAEGTSFSTAWVSGAVALLKPLGWDTSPGNLSRVIERSARAIDGDPRYDDGLLGGGVLDIHAALMAHLLEPGCPADSNDDEMLTPADFSAWVDAYGEGDFAADQNRDGRVDPRDFSSWIANYNAGCP